MRIFKYVSLLPMLLSQWALAGFSSGLVAPVYFLGQDPYPGAVYRSGAQLRVWTSGFIGRFWGYPVHVAEGQEEVWNRIENCLAHDTPPTEFLAPVSHDSGRGWFKVVRAGLHIKIKEISRGVFEPYVRVSAPEWDSVSRSPGLTMMRQRRRSYDVSLNQLKILPKLELGMKAGMLFCDAFPIPGYLVGQDWDDYYVILEEDLQKELPVSGPSGAFQIAPARHSFTATLAVAPKRIRIIKVAEAGIGFPMGAHDFFDMAEKRKFTEDAWLNEVTVESFVSEPGASRTEIIAQAARLLQTKSKLSQPPPQCGSILSLPVKSGQKRSDGD